MNARTAGRRAARGLTWCRSVDSVGGGHVCDRWWWHRGYHADSVSGRLWPGRVAARTRVWVRVRCRLWWWRGARCLALHASALPDGCGLHVASFCDRWRWHRGAHVDRRQGTRWWT